MNLIYIQKKIFFLFGVISLFLLYIPIISSAESNIQFGVLEIHPFVSIEETYNDNIYREPGDDLKNDWITEAIMGIGIFSPLVPERKNDFILLADYKCNIINYADYKDENRIDHTASAMLDLNFANKAFIRLADDYDKTADPATSEMTQLEERFRNNASLIIGRKKKFFGFEFGYRNIRDGYETRNNLDKYENIINANIFFQIFPKTAISIEYRSDIIDYDQNITNSDSNSQEPGLALKGKIAPKTSGVIKGGYRFTEYKDDSKEDFAGFTVFSNITFEVENRFILNIYGEIQPHESTYLTNSYFVSNRGGLKIDLRFVYKFYLAVDGFYQVNKYPEDTIAGLIMEKRTDNLYGGNASLRYELKDTITVKFNYEYTKRDSNIDYFDYKNNQYSGSILLEF